MIEKRRRAAPPVVATRPVGAHVKRRFSGRGCRGCGLVDEVVRDARAGERDHALGEEGEEFVVAPEWSGPAVRVPVGLADDLVDAVPLGPSRRYLLRTGAAAVDENDVGVLGLDLVEMRDDFARVGSLPCRPRRRRGFPGGGGPCSRGPFSRAGSRAPRSPRMSACRSGETCDPRLGLQTSPVSAR